MFHFDTDNTYKYHYGNGNKLKLDIVIRREKRMSEKIVLEATFNPSVKTYWLLSLLLFSTLIVIGIPLLVLSIPIFYLISSKMIAAMSARTYIVGIPGNPNTSFCDTNDTVKFTFKST